MPTLAYRTATLLLLASHVSALRLPTSSPDRAFVVRSACAAALGLAAAPRRAAASDALKQLQQARAQLEPCEAAIADGSWDAVRNVVKTAPLANAKALISAYIREQGEEAEELIPAREDLVQALSMLDMTVYNNVFVSEELGMGKKGSGVKVDRATPLGHLRESKALLDEVLSFGTGR